MLIVAVLIIGILAAKPDRADAHGVGGVRPTNYATRIAADSPGIPGVRVVAIDLGERLELTNRSSEEITVVGYQDEPYLRVGPDGVFENTRSPATYLNRTLVPEAPAPPEANPAAPPEWRKVSDTPVARWHDHRAHWMGPKPAVVRANPREVHELGAWSIPILVNGDPGPEIAGTLTWEPSVSPWPWIAFALALAGVVAVLSRLRLWRFAWLASLGGIAVATLVVATGTWRYTEAGFMNQLFANIYNITGCALATVAWCFALRARRLQVAPLVLLAGVVALFGTGLPGLTDLGAPFIPTAYPASIARLAVTVAIGCGLGLTIGAAQFLKVGGRRSVANPRSPNASGLLPTPPGTLDVPASPPPASE